MLLQVDFIKTILFNKVQFSGGDEARNLRDAIFPCFLLKTYEEERVEGSKL